MLGAGLWCPDGIEQVEHHMYLIRRRTALACRSNRDRGSPVGRGELGQCPREHIVVVGNGGVRVGPEVRLNLCQRG